MAQSTAFSITDVRPTGGAVTDDTIITVRGTGLLKLRQAIFKPRFSIRLVEALDDTEATIPMPCRSMGAGITTLTFTLMGSNVEFASAGGDGLRFVCFQEPRFDGIRPVLGPSWPRSPVTLTTSLVTCVDRS